MRKIITVVFILILIFLSCEFFSYRFNHPKKTETQLFLDMLDGKIFKEIKNIWTGEKVEKLNESNAKNMYIIHKGRREGKTTEALQILRESEGYILLCFNPFAKDQLVEENKDLRKRILSVDHYLQRGRGLRPKGIIIDNADLVPTSVLLELINQCLKRQTSLVATTTK